MFFKKLTEVLIIFFLKLTKQLINETISNKINVTKRLINKINTKKLIKKTFFNKNLRSFFGNWFFGQKPRNLEIGIPVLP